MKHTDDPVKLLRQAFLDIHTAMKGDAIVAGTTALVGLVTQDKLYIANAGTLIYTNYLHIYDANLLFRRQSSSTFITWCS